MRQPRLPYEFAAAVQTERLILRTMTGSDVDDIHAYWSDPEVCRYLLFEPRSRSATAEKIADYGAATVIAETGGFWQPAIVRRTDPETVVGNFYFAVKDPANATCEIGWVLHPAHTGQGYGTEAAEAMLAVAFDVLGLHRAMAQLDPRNLASAALCTRLGMRQEAHFVEDLWVKGEWADTAVYGILQRDWAGRSRSS